MKSGIWYALTFLALGISPARAGDWGWDVGGSARALYGYSDTATRYKKLNDNNHYPADGTLNLSVTYHYNEDYTAGLYLDIMGGTDKEIADYNQGNWGEEAYSIIDTPYGRLMLGQTFNVAGQFYQGAPNTAPLGINNSEIVNFISNPNWARNNRYTSYQTLNAAYINTDGVAPKISYISPEFYKTMVGFSYVPDSYNRRGLINKHARYRNDAGYIVSLYNHQEFSAYELVSSLSYANYHRDDHEAAASLQISRGNWSLGGAYRQSWIDGEDYKIGRTGTGIHTPELFDNYREGKAWNIGVGYEFGPYKAGLSYFEATAQKTDNKDQIVMLSNSYQINKNFELYLLAAHVNFRGDSKMPADNNKGYAFVTGLGFEF